MKKKFEIFGLFLLFFGLSVLNVNIVLGVDVTESELKAVLNDNKNNNIDTTIFDIRWQSVYENGHLRGAILIPSHLSLDAQYQEAKGYLIGKPLNHSIVTLCNCGDGNLARQMEARLQNDGYTKVFHLATSFSLWSDYSFLVSGSNPDGFQVTGTYVDLGGVTGDSPFGDIGFLALLAGIGGLGAFLIYTAVQKPVSNEKLQKSLQKSQQKKDKEIQSIKELVDTKTGETSSTKSAKKGRRRR